MKAVLRVSEAKVKGKVYHRLLLPKKLSAMLGLKNKDRFQVDLLSLRRDGSVVWPRDSSDQDPASTADDQLERETED